MYVPLFVPTTILHTSLTLKIHFTDCQLHRRYLCMYLHTCLQLLPSTSLIEGLENFLDRDGSLSRRTLLYTMSTNDIQIQNKPFYSGSVMFFLNATGKNAANFNHVADSSDVLVLVTAEQILKEYQWLTLSCERG